jgi:hypothetical protein
MAKRPTRKQPSKPSSKGRTARRSLPLSLGPILDAINQVEVRLLALHLTKHDLEEERHEILQFLSGVREILRSRCRRDADRTNDLHRLAD